MDKNPAETSMKDVERMTASQMLPTEQRDVIGMLPYGSLFNGDMHHLSDAFDTLMEKASYMVNMADFSYRVTGVRLTDKMEIEVWGYRKSTATDLPPMTNEQYAGLHKGRRCPSCRSEYIEIQPGPYAEPDAATIDRHMLCRNCSKAWRENFALTGYDHLQQFGEG